MQAKDLRLITHASARFRSLTQDKNQRYNWQKLRSQIITLMNDESHIPYGEEHASQYYHFLQDKTYGKGVYRRSPIQSFKNGHPKWEILFDTRQFDVLLDDDVYLTAYQHYTLSPQRMLLQLSPGGQDHHYTVEWDNTEKQIVNVGFHFPLSRSTVQWRDRNSVWVSPAWEPSMLSQAGYPNQVWLIKRGQSFAQAKCIFQGDSNDLWAEAWRYLDTHGPAVDILCVCQHFHQYRYWIIQDDLTLIPLSLPKGAKLCGYIHGHLLIHFQSTWQQKKRTFLAGSVIALKRQQNALHWKEALSLFVPLKGQSVQAVETSHDCVLIHYLNEVKSAARVLHFNGKELSDIHFPNIAGCCNFELIDQPWLSNRFYIAANDLIHEPILYSFDAKIGHLSVIRRQKPLFSTKNIQLKQNFALSDDGTKVPYFWCGTNKQAPTIVYCYGGFAENQLPHYLPIIGKLWLEKGFSFVIANIRGGAELGPQWHQAALQEKKYKSVEDLVAVVQQLWQQGLSNPQNTALQGASHGGLMVANAMLHLPVRAVLCESPLIDMTLYQQNPNATLWQDEYGDPKNPLIQESLRHLDVSKQIKKNGRYPQFLITLALNDDRVDPLHGLQLHRALQQTEQPSHLIAYHIGGHEKISSQTDYINALTDQWFFLYNSLLSDVKLDSSN